MEAKGPVALAPGMGPLTIHSLPVTRKEDITFEERREILEKRNRQVNNTEAPAAAINAEGRGPTLVPARTEEEMAAAEEGKSKTIQEVAGRADCNLDAVTGTLIFEHTLDQKLPGEKMRRDPRQPSQSSRIRPDKI